MLATPEDLEALNALARQCLGRPVNGFILGDAYAWYVAGRFFVYDVDEECLNLVYPRFKCLGGSTHLHRSWESVPVPITKPADIQLAINWLDERLHDLAPPEGPVFPQGLMAAAHAVILDGAEGSSGARRHASQAWSEDLIAKFKVNYDELMALCTHNPAGRDAEIRLLELCRNITNGALVDAAVAAG